MDMPDTLHVGFYISGPWQQLTWIGFSVIAMGLPVYNRAWRPWQMSKTPYEVIPVSKEAEEILIVAVVLFALR